MRFNFRLKVRNINIFFSIAQVQTMKGIVNKIGDKFAPFWDLENCTLEQVIEELQVIRNVYDLDTIYIFSDSPTSFRAICYTPVDFHTLLNIILNTKYLDYGFYRATVIRGYSILRISTKKNRQKQKVVYTVGQETARIPSFIYTDYDTGTDKISKTIGVLKW
jgi:hypothetical protein